MKLPAEVKILHHTYKVIEVDEIRPDLDNGDEIGDEILGLLDDTNLQILIVRHLHASRKAQVFLHELTHAVMNIIDVRRLLRDPEAEESIVNAISDILLQVLSDNQFKFQKKYTKGTVDVNTIKSIINNHENGVDIDTICKTFHVEEKEVRKIIRQHKAEATKGKKTDKKKKKKEKA